MRSFPHLNVGEQRRLWLAQPAGTRKSEIDARVPRPWRWSSWAGCSRAAQPNFPAGKRQRVALARALIMRPKVLLLDEPLSALDKKLREQMQFEMRNLQQSLGITFVMVTHDQYEAMTMSDRIGVMFDGQAGAGRHSGDALCQSLQPRSGEFHRRDEYPACASSAEAGTH